MKNDPTASPLEPDRPALPVGDDAELLRCYIEERSQDAFTELVRRHVNLVYFAALRRVGGDSHLADDVAQKVFADLAHKAPSLKTRTVLTGWLYTSTRFAAAQAVRSEQRRRTHEQEAQTMHELEATPYLDWNQLRPVIDDVLDELSEPEREAVLLRFFENYPLAEIGARFSLSADAARMRVERALDKLRGQLAKRGIVSTSAALAAVFAAQSGVAAPASLVTRIVAGAAGPGAVTATATFALWKVLTLAAVVTGGMGVAIYWNMRVDREPAVAAKTASAAQGGASATALTALTTDEPVGPESAPAVAPTTSNAGAGGFDGMSVREKNILKNLWEHEKISTGKSPSGWGFKPGPTAPATVIAEFTEAAERLRLRNLVEINSKTETVSLAPDGAAFCQTHATEIDAYPLAPRNSVPIRFALLPAAAKDILKTLWQHETVSPDHPPLRWGFKIPSDAPDFAAFQLAVAGLHEVNGLVGVSAKTGVVFLNERGRMFCAAHANEIDAYPLPARVFRRLSPEPSEPAATP